MTEFVPMLKTPILGDREHLRGTQYYLPSDLRERFNRDYIKEIEARGKQIVLYDTWYLRYYREPYMATFSKDQFVSRWADIWDNLLEITPELKVTVAPPQTKPRWMEAFSDLLAESRFRGGVPAMPGQDMICTCMSDKLTRGINHIDHNLWDRNYVFKFGKYKYNQDSVNDGKIRLISSSQYLSDDMGKAQKDNENQFTFSVMPVFLKNLDGMVGYSDFDRKIYANSLNVQFHSERDYLVWCAAASYDPRIPIAFDYDSVLIIRDKKRFEREIKIALKELNSELSLKSEKVKYFDPYLELHSNIDIQFSKHFRFSYQDEYRVIIDGNDLPKEMYLKIPKLSQYSEVIKLR